MERPNEHDISFASWLPVEQGPWHGRPLESSPAGKKVALWCKVEPLSLAKPRIVLDQFGSVFKKRPPG